MLGRTWRPAAAAACTVLLGFWPCLIGGSVQCMPHKLDKHDLVGFSGKDIMFCNGAHI